MILKFFFKIFFFEMRFQVWTLLTNSREMCSGIMLQLDILHFKNRGRQRMIGVARPLKSYNGRRPRFESKYAAITVLPTVRRRVNPCQRGFGYQKRRRLCQRKHGKRRLQKTNSHVYDYVPARSVDDIVEELVTKEQTSPSGSILPSPTRLTPFTEGS